MANEKKNVGGGHKTNKAAQKKREAYNKGGNAARNAVRRNATVAAHGDPTALEFVRKSGSGLYTKGLVARNNAAIVAKVAKLAAAKAKADTPEFRAKKAAKAAARRIRRDIRIEAVKAAKAGNEQALRFLIANYPAIATPDFIKESEKAAKAAVKKAIEASAEEDLLEQ
jgi:hypothetical protein